MIIPVLTGATGIATEVLKKYLEVVTGKYSVDSLQKTATRRTAIKKKCKKHKCAAAIFGMETSGGRWQQ